MASARDIAARLMLPVRRRVRASSAQGITVSLLLAVCVTAGCDTVEPVDSSLLVIEGYLDTGNPLPEIRVSRTLPPRAAYSEGEAAVTDAKLSIILDGETVAYDADAERPGTYVPGRTDLPAKAGAAYSLQIRWNDSFVEAPGVIPARIRIADIDVSVPDEPVSAVFLDSLSLADTLATGAYTGYIYPIEVTLRWDAESVPDDDSWVRLQLKPYAAFSSAVIDLFLNSDEIVRERDQPVGDSGRRLWTGVYAVGVPEVDAPLPDHTLRVSLIRSGEDYARFAASKNAPTRREPISNLTGAAGIFAAISIDTLNVEVMQELP